MSLQTNFIALLITFCVSGCSWQKKDLDGDKITFLQLKKIVDSLPKNRSEFNEDTKSPDQSKDSVFEKMHPGDKDKQIAVLSCEIDTFQKRQREDKNNPGDWLTSNEGEKQSSAVCSPNADCKFEPYAQKIIIKPGQEHILHGDLHGDIISLITQLDDLYHAGKMDNSFKLAPNVNVAFLGDYVDRGNYGSEVWYTLMRLANANPKQVILIRGNHEDGAMNNRDGFTDELNAKFGSVAKTKDLYDQINQTHELMPVVAYLGNEQGKFLQLCHGGVESGYNPGPLLDSTQKYQQLGVLNRKACCDKIIQDSASSTALKLKLHEMAKYMNDDVKLMAPCRSCEPSLGFMWNDFSTDDNGGEPVVRSLIRNGFEYGKEGTTSTLKQQSTSSSEIVGIIRAHQHTSDPEDPMMKAIMAGSGVAHFWGSKVGDKVDGVSTMNVAPDSVYGSGVGFNYDTSLSIHTDQKGNFLGKINTHYPFCAQEKRKDLFIEN
jgi:hypothetical protein